MIYQWNVPKYSIDAQIAGEELERISSAHSLTPETIVKESRSKKAVLHNMFEWDDKRAGERWREQQAADLLRNIVVVIAKEEENKVEYTRAFVNIIREEDRVYLPLVTVISNEDYHNQYIEQAFKDMEAFKKKYQGVLELKERFWILDQFIRDVKVGLTEKE